MSNITKHALASSMKQLLVKKPLDDITIQNLVDETGVSRKTFYYHFHDIYDLMEWTMIDEGKRLLEGYDLAATWQEAMRSVFRYFQENRAMMLNIYRSVQREEDLFEIHLSRLIRPLLRRVFEQQPGHRQVAEDDRDFILDLYAFGLVELFLRWIGGGMKQDGELLMGKIERIFDGSMESLIRRCLEQ